MSGANPKDAVSDVQATPADGAVVTDASAEPLFRVVRGTPTDVEIAALSVVLAARMRPLAGSASSATSRPGPTTWAASGRLRRPLGLRGPDAWRMSARG